MKACKETRTPCLRLIYDVPTRWNSAYMMLQRAVLLKRAIGMFVADDPDLEHLALTSSEWDQCCALLKILHPFKIESTRIQRTTLPTIDRAYWCYERMFNELDSMQRQLDNKMRLARRSGGSEWVKQLKTSIQEMRTTLQEYYGHALQSIYSRAVLLDPLLKTMLFEAKSFKDDNVDWKHKYISETRSHFISHYGSLDIEDPGLVDPFPRKRKWVDDDEDDEDDFRRQLVEKMDNRTDTEFDRYLQAARAHDTDALNWWRRNQHEYPRLARMVRDIYAVPASSAGVEREFSKARRVASWTRARLNPETIAESMMLKSHLACEGNPLSDMDNNLGMFDEEDVDVDISKLTRDFVKAYSAS